MEAKRIRLSPSVVDSPVGSGGPSSRSSTPTMPSISMTADKLKSLSGADLAKGLEQLKKQLSSKGSVHEFMTKPKYAGMLSAVMEIVQNKTNELGDQGNTTSCPILKDAVGVIANCCYYRTSACLELKQPHMRFTAIAAKILESSNSSVECKCSLMRLIGNMCAHKESALCISGSRTLLEKVALLIEKGHPTTVKQVLRTFRLLIKSSFERVLLMSNTAFHLGKLLSTTEDEKTLEDTVAVLERLNHRYVRDTGQQLAESDAPSRLLTLFIAGNLPAQRLLTALCDGSSDVRDKLGEPGFASIMEASDGSPVYCTLLATFARDAWGRASLRESGSLDLLVSRLSTTDCEKEKLTLVTSLRHFVHDTAGMAHLARSRTFVDTVVRDVRAYVEGHKTECKPVVEESYRPDSPLWMEIESNHMLKSTSQSSQLENAVLHKDYYSAWAYSPVTSSPPNAGRSPTYSPPSSGATSPVQSFSPSHSSSGVLFRAGSPVEWEKESEPPASTIGKSQAAIVESELWLLAWQTQEDSNLPHLIREDVVNCVLSYISQVPSVDYRLGKTLRRMAQSRTSIDVLLDIQFHTRVLHALCAGPCRVVRGAKHCIRCEGRAKFGSEVLREFASHVDSDFGHAFLVQRLESNEFEKRATAAIAKVALVRDQFRVRRRLSSGHQTALDVLFEAIESLLSRDDFEQIANESTYTNGPPLCVQMVGALATLVPSTKPREVFQFDTAYREPQRVPCKLVARPEPGVDVLRFTSSDGKELASVPLEAACKASLYFQGMFTTDLAEKTSNLRSFVHDVEKEGCSADDLTKFLHYLAGCRDKCTQIDTASTCLAMIQLSDRYLVSSLSSWVVSLHGPMFRVLTGASLPLLLPAALTTNMHPRFLSACLLTLVRFALSSDILATLQEIAASPILIEAFCREFRKFVKE